RTIGAAAPGVSNIDFVMSLSLIHISELLLRVWAATRRRGTFQPEIYSYTDYVSSQMGPSTTFKRTWYAPREIQPDHQTFDQSESL
ncbi:MAG: hypothetical protein OXT74_02530, partial [Candidatus Poribacteria bacterium]|nr:hypothetical protein [Candidatus Poribacteria bacterium]